MASKRISPRLTMISRASGGSTMPCGRAMVSMPGRAQNCDSRGPLPLTGLNSISLLAVQEQGERSMLRCVLWAFAAAVQPKALLIADNLCLRQQLVVLQRRKPRPRLEDVDRRFWILACRWFSGWQTSLLVVKPDTVLRWHRQGWRTYWRRRSRRTGRPGRRPIAPELRTLIRRMTTDNRFWGQRRIQAELARLGLKVSARTVAKYMRRPYGGKPSPSWRQFLKRHAQDIWACDFFCVRTIWFQTIYVPSRQPRGPACPGHSSSYSGMGGATNRRMLLLGP